MSPVDSADAVTFVSGRTRVFGIVGHPIEQVRSPEMFTAEFHRRGADALMVPLHVLPERFDEALAGLLRLENLGGVVFTIPYKGRACALAQELGPQATVAGAINALGRGHEGRWIGEIFDGIGCVEAFRRRGFAFRAKRVALIGAGGAGSAIGVAVAHEGPRSVRICDIDAERARGLRERMLGIDPRIRVETGSPVVEDIDYLINASPVGMLDDPRLPIPYDRLPGGLVVLDAVVKPERTRLLALAEASGCTILYGREMMRGQISRMVDFFGYAEPPPTSPATIAPDHSQPGETR